MQKGINVQKISPEGLIEIPISEIEVGDRFMHNNEEWMRIANWSYPIWLKDVPLYVNLENYTIHFIGNPVNDEEKGETIYE